MHTITAEVYYRERMRLPAGSRLRLVMEDVAIQDIAATTIAELTVDDIGAPPYLLELEYDPSLIQERGRYALRAQIRHKDRLLFTSTEHIEAFSPNEVGAVQIRMDHVAHHPSSTAAYLDALTDREWQLITLSGKPAAHGSGGQPLTIQLITENAQVRGFAGCNRYFGSYTPGVEQALEFSDMGATRMACDGHMQQEQQFLDVLSRTSHYQVRQSELILLDPEGKELAVFTPPSVEPAP